MKPATASWRAHSTHIALYVCTRIGVLAWSLLRLPILALLLVMEPVVRVFLWGAALLGLFTAVLFEISGAVPNFPFWLMVSMSIGCMMLLPLYYALLRLFS